MDEEQLAALVEMQNNFSAFGDQISDHILKLVFLKTFALQAGLLLEEFGTITEFVSAK